MSCNARIDAPGALHHIIVRGIERRKIFNDDVDRINFLDRLGKVLSETQNPYKMFCIGFDFQPLFMLSST